MRLSNAVAEDYELFKFIVRMSLLGGTLFDPSREFRGGELVLAHPVPRLLKADFAASRSST